MRSAPGSRSVRWVCLASGERLKGDLLIGADGLRSSVRRSLLGDGEPRYSGATCWRGIASFEIGEGPSQNWWGRGGEFGLFPLPDGRAYWFAVLRRPEREEDGPEGRKADVLQAFGSWPKLVAAAVEATEEGAILRNDLYDRPPTARWGRGRLTLLGDAAHPMLTNAAQGACQALRMRSPSAKQWQPSCRSRPSGTTKPAASGEPTASSPSPAVRQPGPCDEPDRVRFQELLGGASPEDAAVQTTRRDHAFRPGST